MEGPEAMSSGVGRGSEPALRPVETEIYSSVWLSKLTAEKHRICEERIVSIPFFWPELPEPPSSHVKHWNRDMLPR